MQASIHFAKFKENKTKSVLKVNCVDGRYKHIKTIPK